MTRTSAAAALLAVLLVPGSPLAPPAAHAQAPADSATVVADAGLGAGGWKEKVLGATYRDLWTTPVRVPLLRPDTLGGLRVTGTGGGYQTVSLVLRGGDGREYRFRPVRKSPGAGMPADLQETVVHDVVRDQTSSLNPAGALVADRILDAVGLLHASPRLYVMPDHPFLGEHRATFAGTLGMLEERPEEVDGTDITFAGADELQGTDDFLDALEDHADHRVAAEEYLTARLVDLFLGDWDRHADQWRWARYDRPGGGALWRPVPRDRDYVFADYDGWIMRLAGGSWPPANRFTGSYRGTVPGLTWNSEVVDRRLLGGIPRAAWDSAAAHVQARVTDRVIDEAVARLPPEYEAVVGADLRRVLRERRDRLPDAARTFYERIAIAPDLHGTDEADVAQIRRMPDGRVGVTIAPAAGGPPYVDRAFAPGETEEVRVFLHAGADRAVVEGEGSGILVRVVGGADDDHLADRGRGGRTVLYDDAGDNRFETGPGTVVDRREWDLDRSLEPSADPFRDWGSDFAPLTPYATWQPIADVVLGFGPTWTRYGFRRHPWASRQQVRLLWAPLHLRFGVAYRGEFRRTGTDVLTVVDAAATELSAEAFHGYGNRSPEVADGGDRAVWARELRLAPRLVVPLGSAAVATWGAEVRHVDPQPEEGSPADALDPFGTRTFTVAGTGVGISVAALDDPALPRDGFRAAVAGSAYPLVWRGGGEREGEFARAEASAAGYVSPFRGGPTLALRVGGARVWGDFPLQYAAFVGGPQTLHGHRWHRFAGDASAYGGAELRQVLTRAELVVRGDLGVFALADAGRVWFEGESAGGWHTALGGGVFFHTLDHTLRLAYARGERGAVTLELVVPR